MVKKSFTPWHQVVKLREDERSGDLALNSFAADLYDVAMRRGRSVYLDPKEFFALTYPTYNLREMVKDVLLRLSGKNDKAVLQLDLTYGGGKTHSLVTLYHLVNDPKNLPDLPAVNQFREHAGGIIIPKARIAILAFDKLDVEKGMEVRSPHGKTRWLKQPWSVLAYQIAGDEGLKLLQAEGKDEERLSPPAENLMEELLALPQKEKLATLVLIDEVLMYAREKVGLDSAWLPRLQDFFQCLTQSATKVDRACVVASLLATDPLKSDELGRKVIEQLHAVFGREKEKDIQPVEKEDVAEVLRRRFFTPSSIANQDKFRSNVVAALEGIQVLDELTKKNRKEEEERYTSSYPFHPDLTEAFYTKWTGLENFQRTRGVLRTFAMALRDSEKWDTSPLVGANVLLCAPGELRISDAARALCSVAASEEFEGKKQDWAAILEGELNKAREIERDYSALGCRELEQAVMATFLHSQPIGQRAQTRDLMVLLGATRPDRIELEKALLNWTDVSWFLDDSVFTSAGMTGARELPKSWRLGARPNLKQMHSHALKRIDPDLVDLTVRDAIAKEKRLTAGATQIGIRVHNLPQRPSDVQDDGDFHLVILGPISVSEPGKPSSEAKRFIAEKASAENPRVYQNALLLVVPSKEGLELIGNRVRDWLAWQEVASSIEAKGLDDLRKVLLKGYVDQSRSSIPDAIVQAYNIIVAISPKNEIEAFRITTGGESLFETIKKEPRCRIKESAISPDALLPEGPYKLWRPGETSRRASDIIGAFAQFPHLPKMLHQQDIFDTLALGCEQGYFVLKLTRPDQTVRTLWRVRPQDADLRDKSLEVVLPASATLTSIESALLATGSLPGLWPAANSSITVAQVENFFDGKHISKVQKAGYEEPFPVPYASSEVVEKAILEAVKTGKTWLISGPASIFREDIPLGLLTKDAMLNAPPTELVATAFLPQNLPSAWSQDLTTATAISAAMSSKIGKLLPWTIISDGIDTAVRSRLLEVTEGSWPCEWAGAANVKLRIPKNAPVSPPRPINDRLTAEAKLEIGEIQSLADHIGDISKAAVGLDMSFTLRIELAKSGSGQLEKLNEALSKASKKLKFE